MVTVELALGLTTLAIVLAFGVWAIQLLGLQIRCVDAARDTARAVARGDAREVAVAEGRRSAPDGARIDIARSGDRVEAVVIVDVSPPSVFAGMPAIRVTGRATVVVEPGPVDHPGVGVP